MKNWWSDGVIHLEISTPQPNEFTLVGVTWIDSMGLAPFEIDLVVAPSNDNFFAKTVFRIGSLNDHGRPSVCDPDHATARILEKRPRQNREWAMAVELTPPSKNITPQSKLHDSPITSDRTA